MRLRRWIAWKVSPFLALSILGHALLLILVMSTSLGRGCQAVPSDLHMSMVPRNNGPIDVTMIEPTVLNPFAASPTPEEQQAEVEKKVEEARKPEEDRSLRGQVVDIGKPDVEIRPEDAKYLAEFDSKVEKETKAKPGEGKAGARPRPKQVAMASKPSQPSPPRQEIQPQAPVAPSVGGGGAGGKGALAMRTPTEKPSQARGKEDGLEQTTAEGTEAHKGEGEQADQQKGLPGETTPGQQGVEGQSASAGTPASPASVGDLRPSDQLVSQAVGAGSNDYLKDVDEGTDTLLNTKRWKYWSFFSRVKKDVAQSWKPDQAYRLRDPTGQIYGHKNRFTVLKVSLRPDGSLRDVLVEKPCGVDFLDDEAVTAFREAQPFPNPPDGLVDPESRLITFRFGFYFEISGAPTFRIFKQ